MHRNNRGFTLIELLLAGLATVFLGCGIWQLLRASYDSQYMLFNQNGANCDTRQTLDEIADKLRQMKTLTAASAYDATFTDNSGNVIRYWWKSSDNTIRTTTNSLPSGGALVVGCLASLSMSYGSYDSSTATWSFSSSPPDLSKVGYVRLTATSLQHTYTRQLTTSVKLRQVRLDNEQGF